MLTLRRLALLKIHSYHLRLIATESARSGAGTITPVNQTQLLNLCTILFQQQNSPDSRLHSSLSSCNLPVNSELFFQVCNTFPCSWRPVYRFFLYTQTLPHFPHSVLTFNKMIGVIGNARNIDLFWEVLGEMGRRGFVNDKTFRIALRTLAEVSELKKCVEFFHMMNRFGFGYSLGILNNVVEFLCRNKLAEEAKFFTFKLEEWIKPDACTYRWLIWGFSHMGNLIEASKIWNLMVDEGFEPDVEAVETMMDSFFKTNQYGEAMKLFQMMRIKRMDELQLSTYRLVIKWMCKGGKIEQAKLVFDEMCKREIHADNSILASIIYGLLARGRVTEAYKIAEGVDKPDITVYHGLIKGLLRSRRASEATQVFREMINKGCEPIMHTYVMLLQGHLGKRGRKGTDPLVNFDTIFVGGLLKAGRTLEATKFVERTIKRCTEVPRFDYNKFLHYFSNEDGAIMFEEVGKKLKEVGQFDLADILQRYGQKMATRDRRRDRTIEL